MLDVAPFVAHESTAPNIILILCPLYITKTFFGDM